MCGTITVLYPFGLEEGCSANEDFLLNCSSNHTTLRFNADRSGDDRRVVSINVNEGLIVMAATKDDKCGTTHGVYGGHTSPFEYSPNIFKYSPNIFKELHLYFAAANLTCQEARQNTTGYACVSINSTCLPVNVEGDYIGYRCKCEHGFEGNPYIRHGCKDVNECKYDHKTNRCPRVKRQKTILFGIIIGLSAGFGILLLGLSTTVLIHKWRKDIQKQLRRKNFKENQGLLLQQLILSDESTTDRLSIFTLEELEKATNNFDDTRILGRGGHGMVYKGILSDQRVVAIKKSMMIKQSEITQFINEVAILSQVNHRNIVKLLGCCLETDVPLLVYDFVSKGSLFDLLRCNSTNGTALSWIEIIRIAVEVAGALYYLHSAASVSVFHRDVKSSNILLDESYTAKVSDFGASRLVSIDQTHITTKVQGTFGYFDPEYYQTGQLNEKSDVYSFGVVLLELLLMKEPVFTSETGSKKSLAGYFLEKLKKKPLKEIVAAPIYEEATEEEIKNITSLAEMCLRPRGEERPTMKQVEMVLQSLRTEVSNRSNNAIRNEPEIQPLLRTRAEATYESMMVAYHGEGANTSTTLPNQRCYSVEQEFIDSTELPR